jgi:hypothetical protein
MRSLIAVSLVVASLLAATSVAAQDVESLKRELEQMRKQFEGMKDSYEKAINALGDRIQRIESRPAPAAAQPAAPVASPAAAQAPPALGQAAPGPAPAAPPSAIDLVRPRQPFALYERRGPGQLLFDIGVASDFVGNLTQNNVQQAKGGTFAGRENTFFPREIELSFFGQIDPYARGEVRIEAAEEFEDGEASLSVNLAEANLTLMTLPFGTQTKLGLMRNRFGLLNQRHAHDLPQTDRPDVLTQFFGEEGLVESGGELTWVAPLPFYLEALVGLFNGDNETAFGWNSLRNPLVTGRLRTFFDLGDLGAVQLGGSVASGITTEDHRNTIVGVDAKYKFTPEGWQHPLFTLAGEWLYQMRKVDVAGPPANGEGDANGNGSQVTGTTTLDRQGFYVYGETQPWKRWILGTRYDWTEYSTAPGHQWAVGPYLSFMPSEFLRFRLGYKHTEGNTRGCCTNVSDAGSARIKDEFFFQATFILGAHPAHPF